MGRVWAELQLGHLAWACPAATQRIQAGEARGRINSDLGLGL